MTITLPARGGTLIHRMPELLLVAVVGAGATLLAVGARSPYTHGNLTLAFDPAYVRTDQALVGEVSDLMRPASGAALPAEAIARGHALYLAMGCAGCHALEAAGGPVGPRLVGADADTIAGRVRQGPTGMPRFSTTGLTDADVAAIAAYLESLGTK